ncbi:uncharacterized protein LOC126992269 isoform X2 [Eriocheir sinensis]|uniref:uncharacterized protein LOC126992269 isoform X2 n=1 Tax=Eriocheir sinensis TaxID=95602 RepID=UPI0021C8B027|nr:uncharacterized protein LOC126992269 isoform X2 [Eriocheir sinensis]
MEVRVELPREENSQTQTNTQKQTQSCMDVRVELPREENSQTQTNTQKHNKSNMHVVVEIPLEENSRTQTSIEKYNKSNMDVRVELPLDDNSQCEVFLQTHDNNTHGTMEGTMSRLSTPCQRLRKAIMRCQYKCVAGLLLLLLLVGHVATLAYAYHQQGQSDLLRGIAALCSVLVLLLTHGHDSLCRAWLAVHVTYSDDLARGALRVLNNLQAQPLLHGLGLEPPDALDTLAYWWWVLQGLLLATLASFISGPSAPDDENLDDDNPGDDKSDDDNPDDDPGLDFDPVFEEDDFEEVELLEVVVVVEAVDWQFRVGALVPPPDPPVHHPRGEEEGEDEDEFEDVDRREEMEAVEEGQFGVGALAAPPEPPAEEIEEEDGFEEVDRVEMDREEVVEVVEVVVGQFGVGVVAAPPDPPARHPGPVE